MYVPRKAPFVPGRSKTQYRWNNGIPMRLNNRVSTAIPETAGRDMLDHCSLVTVQGGNQWAKFAAFTNGGISWALLMWSTQSWAVPFKTVHQVTGHRHSCASSLWYKATCLPRFCCICLPHVVQVPDCVEPNRSRHSFRIWSRSNWCLDMNLNKVLCQSKRRHPSSLEATNGSSSSSRLCMRISWNPMERWSSGVTTLTQRLSGTEITFTIAALGWMARRPITSGMSPNKSYSLSDLKSNPSPKNVPGTRLVHRRQIYPGRHCTPPH